MTPRGRITFVSRGGQRMFGYQAADMVGTPVRKYWVRGREELRAFRRLLAERGRVENAARRLGSPRRSLYQIRKKYQLDSSRV